MKNKLFYLIGVASILCYTSTFTSCINGVDDEYLEQKFTDNGESNKEGEELPDLNGDYSLEGDFELAMTCNGEVLEGKKVILTVDENNETASIIFTGDQIDLETPISGAIPGGVGGLITVGDSNIQAIVQFREKKKSPLTIYLYLKTEQFISLTVVMSNRHIP